MGVFLFTTESPATAAGIANCSDGPGRFLFELNPSDISVDVGAVIEIAAGRKKIREAHVIKNIADGMEVLSRQCFMSLVRCACVVVINPPEMAGSLASIRGYVWE